MASDEIESNGFKIREIISSVIDSYRRMEMPVNEFFQKILGPAFISSMLVVIVASVVPLSLYIKGPIVGIGVLLPIIALLYPKIQHDRKRREIDDHFHLFITHLTVLSTTNIERVEIFRTLARADEYKALATEMGHIVALVDNMNQSLDDACRMRAKKVPSPLLADFLERLAYSISAGQQIHEFLIDEQDTIIQQFVTRYESDLTKLDVMKELFMSMMLSASFSLVFAIVLPIIMGMNPLTPVGAVIFMFVIIQSVFLFAIHTVSPADPIWFHPERRLKRDWKLLGALAAGFGGAIVLLIAVAVLWWFEVDMFMNKVPLPIRVAIPTLPFLIPGWVARKQESAVKERNSEFVSFIRALGAVETVKQTSTANVLSSLRRKNFGSLTENINNLYKRLNMRIDSTESWNWFIDESGSFLINKFADMYLYGRRLGGNPKQLGQIISSNMTEVLKLREKRQQATNTLTGVVYGITAANVFAFFVGIRVVEMLLGVVEKMDLATGVGGMLLHTQNYDVMLIKFLLLLLILVNALTASIMIRLTDRGHLINAYFHFVMLTWLGCVTAVVTTKIASNAVAV